MSENKETPAGSHHGIPDLLMRDIAVLESYSEWVIAERIVRCDKTVLPNYQEYIKITGNPYDARDNSLINAHNKWVHTASESNKEHHYYGYGWLPHYPDFLKSRLFWRIRSGKEPLQSPPPTCFSCPWYELIENQEVHSTFESIRFFEDGPGKKHASVGQCRYEIITEASLDGPENAATLGFGSYRFKAWNADKEYKGISNGNPISKIYLTGYIQIIP